MLGGILAELHRGLARDREDRVAAGDVSGRILIWHGFAAAAKVLLKGSQGAPPASAVLCTLAATHSLTGSA